MSAKEKPQAESFDLDSIDTRIACNKAIEVELVNPATKKPLGIFWSVLGNDSDEAREYNRNQINADGRKAAYAKKRGKDPEVKTIEVLEQETVDWLTICSTGWRSSDGNVIKYKGELLEFNVPNCRRILTEKSFIRQQLSEEILDLENFMKG